MEQLVQDKDLVFQPAINRKSAAMAEQRATVAGAGGRGDGVDNGPVPVEERLQEEARRREQRHRSRQ